ncbi:relaxase/mobilization nuclease domain-containing protein [Actinoplanes regularis]|uniref:relaxase/mobilization nuclease domain-containing protein n=1 Tax=Actinoplanes regularis TaxID=52697 RepID=UPI0024A45430|nr:relaxase [Actinoplanes regularis]GLW36021.1 mobilization protein [Actinoplanes regularis]
MIPKVAARGQHVGGLLRYLYGPGKREEHRGPRLVACWAPERSLAGLEPVMGADGGRDFRALTRLLEQPVRAGQYPPAQPVWHCSVRNHASDRILSDSEWADIAREMVAGAGLAPHGDTRAVRWVAVRHATDHIHIVATLVRQDGTTVWLPTTEWRRCQTTARRLEARYGLRRVGPPDHTAHRYPHGGEINKAIRKGRTSTPRDDLRRRVRTAAAAAGTEDEFFDVLRRDGVLVRLRTSPHDGQITGYAVALPGIRTAADQQPIYFSGGKLAADLTLPKLRIRWGADPDPTPRPPKPAINRHARATALRQATQATQRAAPVIKDGARGDQTGVQATVAATADLLATLAYASEGDWPGPLHRAADHFDRAARGRYGRVAAPTSRSLDLRSQARLIWLMGRISGDEDAYAALRLVLQLARLADAIEELRAAQQRLHQARDARVAAEALRRIAAGAQTPVALTATTRPTPPRTVGGGRRTRPGRPTAGR